MTIDINRYESLVLDEILSDFLKDNEDYEGSKINQAVENILSQLQSN